MAFLPNEALRRLTESQQAGRLGHAYLITGAVDSMLVDFVKELAVLILGISGKALEHHIDYHSVSPESKSRRILVEQIREMEHVIHQKPAAGENKVCVIFEADRLVEAASNAFLKSLEEPPPGTYLLLTSALPEAMLGTIISRCIEIPLRSASPPQRSKREESTREIARHLLDASAPCGLAEIFLAVRKFQQLLSETREEITTASAALLKAEKEHYKDRIDSGNKWLEEKEAHLEAYAESMVLRERTRLLDALASILVERLRSYATSGDPRIHNHHTLRLLQQIEGVTKLRTSFDRNVHESLALETSFIEIFAHT